MGSFSWSIHGRHRLKQVLPHTKVNKGLVKRCLLNKICVTMSTQYISQSNNCFPSQTTGTWHGNTTQQHAAERKETTLIIYTVYEEILFLETIQYTCSSLALCVNCVVKYEEEEEEEDFLVACLLHTRLQEACSDA